MKIVDLLKRESVEPVSYTHLDVYKRQRVIRILSRSWKDRMLTDEPFVMAARDIYPSEAIQFDTAKVLGLSLIHI